MPRPSHPFLERIKQFTEFVNRRRDCFRFRTKFGNSTNHDFTQRELDILKELTGGDSNADIARRLHISAGTVKSHIQHLLEKTGFRTRTELASEARSLGIGIRKVAKEQDRIPE